MFFDFLYVEIVIYLFKIWSIYIYIHDYISHDFFFSIQFIVIKLIS